MASECWALKASSRAWSLPEGDRRPSCSGKPSLPCPCSHPADLPVSNAAGSCVFRIGGRGALKQMPGSKANTRPICLYSPSLALSLSCSLNPHPGSRAIRNHCWGPRTGCPEHSAECSMGRDLEASCDSAPCGVHTCGSAQPVARGPGAQAGEGRAGQVGLDGFAVREKECVPWSSGCLLWRFCCWTVGGRAGPQSWGPGLSAVSLNRAT